MSQEGVKVYGDVLRTAKISGDAPWARLGQYPGRNKTTQLHKRMKMS